LGLELFSYDRLFQENFYWRNDFSCMFFSSVCAVFVLTVGGVAFAFLVFVQNNQRNASEGKSSNGISRVLGAGVGPILPRKKIIDLFFFVGFPHSTKVKNIGILKLSFFRLLAHASTNPHNFLIFWV